MATRIEGVAAVAGGWRHGRDARRLTAKAAARALGRAGVAAADVELLVNAGIYHRRNLGEPALAALLQEDIGANPEDPHGDAPGTFSFDVANGSCGMLTGLKVADGFLRAGTVREALVVAGDSDPGRRMAPGFPFRPASAAVVCGWAPGPGGLADVRLATADPRGAGAAGAAGGGLEATIGFRGGRNILAVEEEPGFAAATAAWAAEVAAKLLADHGVALADVDLVVANPLTGAFLVALGEGLGVPADRLVAPPTGRPAGHTAGLGVGLDLAARAGRLAGATVLLVSGAAGPSAGAALLRG